MDGLWVTKSEDVGLIVCEISFQDFQPVVIIHQRHTPADRQTTCDRKTALCTIVHRAEKIIVIVITINIMTVIEIRRTDIQIDRISVALYAVFQNTV